LADRSVVLTLQKRKPGEYVEDFRDDRADDLRELECLIRVDSGP